MFSRKELTTKSTIAITDESISYVTLAKDNNGFFIKEYETVTIPEGVIQDGEILKADILFQMLKKIARLVSNKNIDIVLPHKYFLCADGTLDDTDKKDSLKKRVQRYFKTTAMNEPWHKTHICEFSTYTLQGREKVLFKCLPKDIQKSYVHVCKRAGFQISSLTSDILAFDDFLSDEGSILVFVSNNYTRVAEFKSGMFVSSKTFQVSYQQFIQDIQKYINTSSKEAGLILKKHGLLRSHKDEKVYTRLSRSMSPLIEYLSKRKLKESVSLYVVFEEQPILGFYDYLFQSLRITTIELDIFNTPKYIFHDILSLHKNESYRYQPIIAQALKNWKK